VACCALWLAGRTEDHLVEITFTTVAAYGSFLLAEHFHLSGVLAPIAGGREPRREMVHMRKYGQNRSFLACLS
jgi:NhaP-type Na+/H+ or K+/H+ antiporter